VELAELSETAENSEIFRPSTEAKRIWKLMNEIPLEFLPRSPTDFKKMRNPMFWIDKRELNK